MPGEKIRQLSPLALNGGGGAGRGLPTQTWAPDSPAIMQSSVDLHPHRSRDRWRGQAGQRLQSFRRTGETRSEPRLPPHFPLLWAGSYVDSSMGHFRKQNPGGGPPHPLGLDWGGSPPTASSLWAGRKGRAEPASVPSTAQWGAREEEGAPPPSSKGRMGGAVGEAGQRLPLGKVSFLPD